MREQIISVAEGDEAINQPCGQCNKPIAAGDQIVYCPRCKQIHHLDCWIANGGCARRGCRQVMSPHLRPPKEETPIVEKKVPRWVIATVAVLLIAIGVGVYFNGKRAAALRERSAYVLIPSLEDQLFWERIVAEYNQTEDGDVHPAQLIFTPYGPAGTFYEQKLLVMIAANDAPEFTVIEAPRLSTFIEQGALKPLDDEVQQLLESGLRLDPERIALATREDSIYAVPHPYREAYFVVPHTPRNPEASRRVFPYFVQRIYQEASPPSPL